jgi:hypothetical protein
MAADSSTQRVFEHALCGLTCKQRVQTTKASSASLRTVFSYQDVTLL